MDPKHWLSGQQVAQQRERVSSQGETGVNDPSVRWLEKASCLAGTLKQVQEMDTQECKGRVLPALKEAGPMSW